MFYQSNQKSFRFRRAVLISAAAVAVSAGTLTPASYAHELKGDLKPEKAPAGASPHGNMSTGDAALDNADYHLVYTKAEEARRAGQEKDAAVLYLQAVNLEPTLWVAYHQLANLKTDTTQIDAAMTKLNDMKAKQPKELMLRVALSELLEKRGDYYQASRELVDLVYANAVPDKYSKKINARIHYLLSKSKHAYTNVQNSEFENLRTEEELDTVPPPLPDPGLVVRDLASTKSKDIPAMQGSGHTQLQP
ncbi:MAG: hypothetical protein K2X29_02930 [Candidatus Obscuribacterales bacterium]|nr:hypothetical protein [Candidatus Obscuribacterales bacterium]